MSAEMGAMAIRRHCAELSFRNSATSRSARAATFAKMKA